MTIEKICEICKIPFSVKPSHVDRRRYCSRDCMATGYQKRMTGEGNPNYREATGTDCGFCGKTFRNYSKTQKYCSIACARKGSEKHKEGWSKIQHLGAQKKKAMALEKWSQALSLLASDDAPKAQLKLALSFDTRKRFYCDVCGKEFYSIHQRSTCSRDCHIKWLAQFNARTVTKHCVICGKEMKLSPSRLAQIKTCSAECKSIRKSIFQKGEKSHLWKGGKTSATMLARTSADYERWRKGIFKRDDYTCQMCGVRGGKLAAHHIKLFSDHEDLRLNPGNGISLCWKCHSSIRAKENEYEDLFFAITGGV